MTKLKSIVLAVIVAMAVMSCENFGGDSNEKTTASGLTYRYIIKSELAEQPEGKYLMLNMVYTDDNDSAWLDTREAGNTIPVPKPDSTMLATGTSLEQVFAVLTKGDSIEFSIPVTEFFEGLPGGRIPPGVDTVGNFNFTIGVEDVMTEQQVRARQQELQIKQSQEQLATDITIIDQYLADNNITAETTASGLRYTITEAGNGHKPSVGDTVRVNYTGQLMDGQVFDTSREDVARENGIFSPQRPAYDPLKFPLGVRAVISGWDEGIGYLDEGAKAKLYIPSTLAYGPRGAGGAIGPNSILIFDVELVEIIN